MNRRLSIFAVPFALFVIIMAGMFATTATSYASWNPAHQDHQGACSTATLNVNVAASNLQYNGVLSPFSAAIGIFAVNGNLQWQFGHNVVVGEVVKATTMNDTGCNGQSGGSFWAKLRTLSVGEMVGVRNPPSVGSRACSQPNQKGCVPGPVVWYTVVFPVSCWNKLYILHFKVPVRIFVHSKPKPKPPPKKKTTTTTTTTTTAPASTTTTTATTTTTTPTPVVVTGGCQAGWYLIGTTCVSETNICSNVGGTMVGNICVSYTIIAGACSTVTISFGSGSPITTTTAGGNCTTSTTTTTTTSAPPPPTPPSVTITTQGQEWWTSSTGHSVCTLVIGTAGDKIELTLNPKYGRFTDGGQVTFTSTGSDHVCDSSYAAPPDLPPTITPESDFGLPAGTYDKVEAWAVDMSNQTSTPTADPLPDNQVAYEQIQESPPSFN